MRLGLNLGYQTAWTTPAHHLALAQEADRLGYSVVWAAEAYGSDSPSMLAWIAGQTERIDVGSAVMQIPARTPGGDRDDRGHHRHALRRPVPARPGRVRPAGLRGLARRAVRQAAGAHPGVRRHRPAGAGPQAGGVRRRALPAAAARRPGQGAAAELPPAARGHPDLPGRGRARRTWSWPARSPTAGWRSSSPRSSPPSSSAAIARRAGEGRQGPGRLRRGAGGAGGGRRRPRPPAPSWSAGTPRSTSAAWAAASRTSTTSWPPGWATATPPARCRTSTWPSGTATPRPRCRWSSSTAPGCSARRSGSPSGCAQYAEAGVTTLSVTLFAADADSGVATLRACAEALRACRGLRTSGPWMSLWRGDRPRHRQGLTEFLPVSSPGT